MNSDYNNSCTLDNGNKTDINVSVTYLDENTKDNNNSKSMATEQLLDVLKKYSNDI